MAYNKKVKTKTFVKGELVMTLPIGSKDSKLGKWPPNWERQVEVYKVLKGGTYHLRNLDGQAHNRLIYR